jgi:hypothetical protein
MMTSPWQPSIRTEAKGGRTSQTFKRSEQAEGFPSRIEEAACALSSDVAS